MNAKAAALGLASARFQDPAGLSSGNVASAKDLARIVDQAYRYPEIRTCSTTEETTIQGRYRPILFHNTNRLLQSGRWQIGLSKTGYIDESGQCLVMQAQMKERPVLIVLLDSQGKGSRFGDANRIRQWLEGVDEATPRRVARVRKHPKLVKVVQVRRPAKAARPVKAAPARRGQGRPPGQGPPAPEGLGRPAGDVRLDRRPRRNGAHHHRAPPGLDLPRRLLAPGPGRALAHRRARRRLHRRVPAAGREHCPGIQRVQTEMTTISGSTSLRRMPSMAIRVPVRPDGQELQAPW